MSELSRHPGGDGPGDAPALSGWTRCLMALGMGWSPISSELALLIQQAYRRDGRAARISGERSVSDEA
jgi:hypothetical protein